MTAGTVEPVNLRRREIATFLNVCMNEVDRLIKCQAFPSFKIGGQRVARKVDVEAYNDKLAADAASSAARIT